MIVMMLDPPVGSATYQGFLSVKANLNFAISVIKTLLLESKGLDDREKGQQPQGAGLCPHTAYCVVQQISRSTLPVG